MKRCLHFTAYERAEQKKSRKIGFRAAAQSGTSSFRTVCKTFASQRAEAPQASIDKTHETCAVNRVNPRFQGRVLGAALVAAVACAWAGSASAETRWWVPSSKECAPAQDHGASSPAERVEMGRSRGDWPKILDWGDGRVEVLLGATWCGDRICSFSGKALFFRSREACQSVLQADIAAGERAQKSRWTIIDRLRTAATRPLGREQT
jgi:hypothetical protein